MKGYIYKYIFSDGKVYIGQTRRPMELRHKEHLNEKTGYLNTGFWNAYQLLGEPKLEMLETIESEDINELVHKLNSFETYYIHQYDATNPEHGYNIMTSGSVSNPNHSILRDEFREIYARFMEDFLPIYKSSLEKVYNNQYELLTPEEQEFVDSYVYSNNLFTISKEDASKPHEDITDEDDGFDDDNFMLYEAFDYAKFMYEEEVNDVINRYIQQNSKAIIEKRTRHKIIQKLDLEGNLIKEYRSLDGIRDELQLTRTDNITNVLKGRQKTAYGYIWKKKFE